MGKLHNTKKNKYITYNKYQTTQKNMPSVIFLHGLMSDMDGKKSSFFKQYCQQRNYNYITFDNFGHGKSSGIFIEETIGSWLEGVELVLSKIVEEPSIIIGSSMGAWLSILVAQKCSNKVKALICIAPAIDFTEELLWKKLPEGHKKQLEQQKLLEVSNNYGNIFPISYQLIVEARKHLLFGTNNIKLEIPVHLIHGMLDTEVPYTFSYKLLEKITSNNIVMKLIKDADHRLSRETDLAIIVNSIEEILEMI